MASTWHLPYWSRAWCFPFQLHDSNSGHWFLALGFSGNNKSLALAWAIYTEPWEGSQAVHVCSCAVVVNTGLHSLLAWVWWRDLTIIWGWPNGPPSMHSRHNIIPNTFPIKTNPSPWLFNNFSSVNLAPDPWLSTQNVSSPHWVDSTLFTLEFSEYAIISG